MQATMLILPHDVVDRLMQSLAGWIYRVVILVLVVIVTLQVVQP